MTDTPRSATAKKIDRSGKWTTVIGTLTSIAWARGKNCRRGTVTLASKNSRGAVTETVFQTFDENLLGLLESLDQGSKIVVKGFFGAQEWISEGESTFTQELKPLWISEHPLR
jgi:hypothetical protein